MQEKKSTKNRKNNVKEKTNPNNCRKIHSRQEQAQAIRREMSSIEESTNPIRHPQNILESLSRTTDQWILAHTVLKKLVHRMPRIVQGVLMGPIQS